MRGALALLPPPLFPPPMIPAEKRILEIEAI